MFVELQCAVHAWAILCGLRCVYELGRRSKVLPKGGSSVHGEQWEQGLCRRGRPAWGELRVLENVAGVQYFLGERRRAREERI